MRPVPARRSPVLLVVAALLALLALPGCDAGADLAIDVDALRTSTRPDEALTPGSLCTRDDPDYDGDRYAEQVPHCRRHVTRATRIAVAAAYGIAEWELGDYEIDHRISLSLGGSNAADNLWPLYKPEARRKAKFEFKLYQQLASGAITQDEAIAAVLDWQ
jgi:hypothetical protein